ncbi:MAG TPA: 1-(5-phosphoribosyl)-5-[(5-phosphoribosylamino)methylideneamino]imidazole-4-carboxamide isomerase [Anaerolineae bacterium]|nr:1-(5-phosphoribosyl)-5-[(5-phosphoribosylamino)methylideneamino]imidazole-4-carboxamide isomerase [Anaerolineae bacterium]
MMADFSVYPAIDLRGGKVVRLAQGDPDRQTVYGDDPVAVAERWKAEGATWLHVVNLDGAFGADQQLNRQALSAVLNVGLPVQFGGGLRALADVERALSLGVTRVVLGTLAIEQLDVLREAVQRFGPAQIAVGLDARDGRVKTRGWQVDGGSDAIEIGKQVRAAGVEIVIHTDIARDGVGRGVNVEASRRLADETGLSVVASGGVAALEDVRKVWRAGLAGVIVGRALYEGQLTLKEAIDER